MNPTGASGAGGERHAIADIDVAGDDRIVTAPDDGTAYSILSSFPLQREGISTSGGAPSREDVVESSHRRDGDLNDSGDQNAVRFAAHRNRILKLVNEALKIGAPPPSPRSETQDEAKTMKETPARLGSSLPQTIHSCSFFSKNEEERGEEEEEDDKGGETTSTENKDQQEGGGYPPPPPPPSSRPPAGASTSG